MIKFIKLMISKIFMKKYKNYENLQKLWLMIKFIKVMKKYKTCD
jgi:hypothetical protein